MATHVCPPWIGWLLVNPLRRLFADPAKIFAGLVAPGAWVLEPGPGMGYFTLPLARMVGPQGRVVAVDVQAAMLARLERRARRAGLHERVETRLVQGDLGVADLQGRFDLCATIHVVHEVPDQARFFAEVAGALRPGGKLLVIEPRGHVSEAAFEASAALAGQAGLRSLENDPGQRRALLERA